MRFLLFLLVSFNLLASPTEELSQQWMGRVKVIQRHTGYKDGETLRAPQGTWQNLFNVVLGTELHCVHARIPTQGKSDGEIKIVSIKLDADCSKTWERPGFWEEKNIRSIQFLVSGNEIKIWWSDEDGRIHSFSSKTPEIKGVFFYPPGKSSENVKVKMWGDIDDVYPSTPCSYDEGTCQLCKYGVYRVAESAPEYFCGVDRCGERNMPACPRGKRWQKSRGTFSCRGNHEHVFCSKGLRVECLGEVAICR